MSERTVLITGGNSGLGLACARQVAAVGGWRIVLASRNQEASLRVAAGLPDAEARALDLGSLADVRRFAAALASDLESGKLPPLRALVWNAGLQFRGRRASEDGFEATFAVNHLGHFLLTHLLLDHVAAPARIVFVSSGTHDPDQRTGMPDPAWRDARALADPAAETGDGDAVFARRAYTTSKLCNVLCAYELDRRLQETGRSTPAAPITVNAFDPGLMPGTGLARHYVGWQRALWSTVFHALRVLPGVNSTRSSGAALARLVVDPALERTSSRYFAGTRERRSSRDSYDTDKARSLWQQSADLVGIQAL